MSWVSFWLNRGAAPARVRILLWFSQNRGHGQGQKTCNKSAKTKSRGEESNGISFFPHRYVQKKSSQHFFGSAQLSWEKWMKSNFLINLKPNFPMWMNAWDWNNKIYVFFFDPKFKSKLKKTQMLGPELFVAKKTLIWFLPLNLNIPFLQLATYSKVNPISKRQKWTVDSKRLLARWFVQKITKK